MASIVIEGDPRHLEELLDELRERHYLPEELNVSLYDADPVALLCQGIGGINDELHPWFAGGGLLAADERKWLETAEEICGSQTRHHWR